MFLINISQFLEKSGSLPVIDVRSEAEYAQGHIPGAINIPLLNNDDRREVGISYKLKGSEAAVLLGYKLVGPVFHLLIKRAIESAPSKQVMVYCWRGGLRSKIFSELLENAGLEVYKLAGGYKSFRRQIIKSFEKPLNLKVLGGLTCSGKTELLKLLQSQGEQIIDLEGLANHKGSAFGGIGRVQPGQEQFENQLGIEIMKADDKKVLWIEDESQSIGKNVIPKALWNQLRNSLLVEINIPMELRLQRVLDEYAGLDKVLLEERTLTLKKRLGDLRTRELAGYLHEGNFHEWGKALLEYYDKTYAFGQSKREALKRIKINLDSPTDIASFLAQIMGSGWFEKQKGAKAP
jgi:tRNA 2-selenouridine synthase